MHIIFHGNFKKQYRKLTENEKQKCNKRLIIFEKNPFHPLLNNHKLHGKLKNYRSININSDLRAIYEIIGDDIQFIFIGTHSELYD